MAYEQPIRISQRFTFPKDWKPLPTDGFDVKIAGKYLWLKRLLWKWLRKLGCVSQHWDREMVMTEMVLDPEKVTVEILMRAQQQFMQMYQKNPVTVYMGNEDLSDIMSDPMILQMGGFSYFSQARRSSGDGKYELLNMKIEVVPHMRGILVV